MDTPPDPSASSAEVETILSRAARVLGSIESPDYRRVKLNTQRYARLIAELSTNFWIRDTSDVNEDVSSVLLLRRDKWEYSEDFILYISNVVEYAFAMRMNASPANFDPELGTLAVLLRRNGLDVLSREILSTPVKTTMFNSENPKLFNVLFSDTVYLPWETADQSADDPSANDP